MTNPHAATRIVKAGRPAPEPDAPLNEPITMASAYVAGGDLEYGRYANPTWKAFEEALGELESGECVSFASGLAAVAAVLDLVPHGGTVVAPRHCYGGTLGQLAALEERGRVHVRLVDATDEAALHAAMTGAALVWLESPTNPALEVIDLVAAIDAGHGAQARVVVDNTFATPLAQRPLELGADIVVHSATKMLSGHSDVLLGAALTADPQVRDALKSHRDLTGAIPGTVEAWLALRGFRTLHLRFERSQSNATILADRLSHHPAVSDVRYPGFGSMISIVLNGGVGAADRLSASTSVWVHATSLGGVESTLERRRRWGSESPTVPEALVRLSVGIEDVEDLWEDLERALGE
jgi:cystathionine gamma-synthase